MRSLAISAFKAHALELVGKVASTREGIVVTKRGKPLAQVLPYQPSGDAPVAGRLAEALVFERDIVSPLRAESWEAAR
ncbi:MAG: type II toxin-antitoxin system Phd/YefM family antitoxin [Acidobacteria bacterium]|nr:type II toxin-antitoxin system Phd/YefM family antitoxin [Acidobacteriota bacterium]